MLVIILGDFNHDVVVIAGDYVVWRKTNGTLSGYNVWRSHFNQTAGSGTGASLESAVPEPATVGLLMLVKGCAA
jgi:hypothetical protein